MSKIKLLLINMVLPAVLFFNCSIQSISDSDQQNFTFTEFLKVNNFQEKDDCYIYEGDIAFDKSEVVKLYNDFLCGKIKRNMNNRGNIAINPDTGSRWVWTSAERRNITYRFNGSMATRFLTDAQVRSAFREAAARWMNVANVRIDEVTSGGVFVVQTYRVAESNGGITTARSLIANRCREMGCSAAVRLRSL